MTFNRIQYFPAQVPISLLTTQNIKFLNYHVSWYKKNSIIHHPNLLTGYTEDFYTQRYLTFLEGLIHDKELFSNIISEKVKDTIKYIDDKLEGKGRVTF